MDPDKRSSLRRYYEEKGFQNMMVARVLGLLALLFTIFFSGMFLLGLNWSALFSECIREDTCDVSEVRYQPARLEKSAEMQEATRRPSPLQAGPVGHIGGRNYRCRQML